MSANLYLICAMALLLIGGFLSAVQLFRGWTGWGQARRMGIVTNDSLQRPVG